MNIYYGTPSSRHGKDTLERTMKEHPPWALPSYVVDTHEGHNTLYFCKNLQAVNMVLGLMVDGGDKISDRLTVEPYSPQRLYIEESHVEEMFFLFLKAEDTTPNWTVIFEYTSNDLECEILSL